MARSISISVECLYGGPARSFDGTKRQVAAELLLAFPWLRRDRPVGDLNFNSIVGQLGQAQAYVVSIAQLGRTTA